MQRDLFEVSTSFYYRSGLNLKFKWIEDSFVYEGSQLRSLFAYLNYGVRGSSIIGWRGPCKVSLEHMIDGEDLLAQAKIEGSDMAHFLLELFNCELLAAVGIQRLMTSICKDLLIEKIGHSEKKWERRGDDLYYEKRKFNISIATKSPTSALIHFAFNLSREGTPIPTSALSEFDIPPIPFAKEFMERVVGEIQNMREATEKVRWAP